MPPKSGSPEDSGFTVLEAAVSLAIVALALGAFYDVARTCFAAVRDARHDAFIASQADSIFAGLGILYPLRTGVQTILSNNEDVVTLEIRSSEQSGSPETRPLLAVFDADLTFKDLQTLEHVRRFHTIRLQLANSTP